MGHRATPSPVALGSPGGPSGFRSPYLCLALNSLVVTASELLLKRGAMVTTGSAGPPWLETFGFATLGSGWVWAGIACYLVSFFNWLYVLRWIPLSIAFPLASVVHALIPLGAWWVLGEALNPWRWGGIAMILGGIWLIAESLMRAEDAL